MDTVILHKAMAKLAKERGAKYTIKTVKGNTEYVWHSADIEIPSKQEIDAKYVELLAKASGDKWIQDRREAYGKLNQLELMGNDAIHGTTTYKEALLAIKAKYPKS